MAWTPALGPPLTFIWFVGVGVVSASSTASISLIPSAASGRLDGCNFWGGLVLVVGGGLVEAGYDRDGRGVGRPDGVGLVEDVLVGVGGEVHVGNLVPDHGGQTLAPDPEDGVGAVAACQWGHIRTNIIQNLVPQVRWCTGHNSCDSSIEVVCSFGANFFNNGFFEIKVCCCSRLRLL